MAIANLNIGDYIQKQNGDEISANEWNTIFTAIQSSVNSVISAVNFGGGGSGGSSSGGNGGPSTALYVNGVLHTETPIILEPQGTYKLQGELYGQLIVNAAQYAGDAPVDFKNTNLIFDGVTIITSADCGVYYTVPEIGRGYKGITITLAGDSVNTVMCTTVAASANDQHGAIYSQNNLKIQGSGYLNCINKGGHAIRAQELKLFNPHIYCDAIHDGIHAKTIHIYDGVYYFTNINDCFGTSDSVNAAIYVCGGKIIANNMKTSGGNIFDYQHGTAYYIKKPEIITNIPKTRYATAPADASSTSGALGQYTLNGDLQLIQNAGYYGAGTIRAYATKADMEAGGASGGVEVTLKSGIYTIDSTYSGKKAFGIYGMISAPIYIAESYTSATSDHSVNFYLCGACITSGGTNPCIKYSIKANRIKIESYKGKHNMIIQNEQTGSGSSYDYDAIKSENNIEFELGGGSTLYISSHLGDGVDGSDVKLTDSTGVLYIENCGQRGIKGTTILIGPNADIAGGVPTYYVETAEEAIDANHIIADPTHPATYFDGCVIARNNCLINPPSDIGTTTGEQSKAVGFADIYARKGKRSGASTDKGSLFVLNKYLTGVVICDHVGAMIKADFDFSMNIYVSKIISAGIYNLERLTNEQYLVYPKYSAPIIDKSKFKAEVAVSQQKQR